MSGVCSLGNLNRFSSRANQTLHKLCQYNFCKCLSTSMQKEAKFIIFIKRVCAMFDWHEMRTCLNYQVNTHQTSSMVAMGHYSLWPVKNLHQSMYCLNYYDLSRNWIIRNKTSLWFYNNSFCSDSVKHIGKVQIIRDILKVRFVFR
jgi:hypothetical protein